MSAFLGVFAFIIPFVAWWWVSRASKQRSRALTEEALHHGAEWVAPIYAPVGQPSLSGAGGQACIAVFPDSVRLMFLFPRKDIIIRRSDLLSAALDEHPGRTVPGLYRRSGRPYFILAWRGEGEPKAGLGSPEAAKIVAALATRSGASR